MFAQPKMKQITGVIIITFILTQCGLGLAALAMNLSKTNGSGPIYNKVGQNLRERNIETPSDARAVGMSGELRKVEVTIAGANGLNDEEREEFEQYKQIGIISVDEGGLYVVWENWMFGSMLDETMLWQNDVDEREALNAARRIYISAIYYKRISHESNVLMEYFDDITSNVLDNNLTQLKLGDVIVSKSGTVRLFCGIEENVLFFQTAKLHTINAEKVAVRVVIDGIRSGTAKCYRCKPIALPSAAGAAATGATTIAGATGIRQAIRQQIENIDAQLPGVAEERDRLAFLMEQNWHDNAGRRYVRPWHIALDRIASLTSERNRLELRFKEITPSIGVITDIPLSPRVTELMEQYRSEGGTVDLIDISVEGYEVKINQHDRIVTCILDDQNKTKIFAALGSMNIGHEDVENEQKLAELLEAI